MANYKVPQNVEAEDKLLGPFTFRQFIYLITAGVGVIVAWAFSKISIYLTFVPLPLILIFAILGFYRREDQPVESYLLAALNYLLKPRRRLWNNEGIVERVHLTAPKRLAPPKPKNLSSEHGQLEWLAHIMDTRGWSIKRAELTEPRDGQDITMGDRLVVPIVSNQAQEPIDVHLADDVMDTKNNPDADRFAALAEEASRIARDAALAKMQQAMKPVQVKPNQAQAPHQPPPPVKGTAKSDVPLPTKVEFDPFPQAITQKMIDPATGKFALMRKQIISNAKPSKLDHNLSPDNPAASTYHKLAQNDEVPVSEIAKQAQKAHQSSLDQGQEVQLHGA